MSEIVFEENLSKRSDFVRFEIFRKIYVFVLTRVKFIYACIDRQLKYLLTVTIYFTTIIYKSTDKTKFLKYLLELLISNLHEDLGLKSHEITLKLYENDSNHMNFTAITKLCAIIKS